MGKRTFTKNGKSSGTLSANKRYRRHWSPGDTAGCRKSKTTVGGPCTASILRPTVSRYYTGSNVIAGTNGYRVSHSLWMTNRCKDHRLENTFMAMPVRNISGMMEETNKHTIIKSAWKLKLPPARSLAVIRDPEMAYRRYAAVGFYYQGE